jgi:hypothetical protein
LGGWSTRNSSVGGVTWGYCAAVSLDGRMMMQTTVWGNGTLSSIVIRP